MGQRWLTYGSTETVRAQLQDYLDATGANYLAGVFAWGNLSDEQVLTSLDLFTTHVRPRLVVRTPAVTIS